MRYPILFILLITALSSQAQITIQNTDLPHGGDVFLFSNGNVFNISSNDLQQTGADQQWDFQLESISQQYDTSYSMSQVPLIFLATFFSSDYADRLAPDVNLGVLSITNNYSFYNLASSKLEQTGTGSYISGLPLPVFYNPKDVVYRLPLEYGDADSCTSHFTAGVPTLGSWKEGKKRVNHVDGWGILKTPFGDKEVLRVRSEIFYNDTIKIDTPFSLPATPFARHQVEYKWLAKDGGFPMLQVITNVLFGTEVIAQVIYQDTLDISGIDKISFNNKFNVFPQPANEKCVIASKGGEQVDEVNIYDMYGRWLKKITGNKQSIINISTSAFNAGLYNVILQCGGKQFTTKISVVH